MPLRVSKRRRMRRAQLGKLEKSRVSDTYRKDLTEALAAFTAWALMKSVRVDRLQEDPAAVDELLRAYIEEGFAEKARILILRRTHKRQRLTREGGPDN